LNERDLFGGDPFDRRGRGRRRGHGFGNEARPAECFTAQKQLSSCFVGPIAVLGRRCQVASCQLECKSSQHSRRGGRVAPGCSNAGAGELQGCERIAQQPGNQLHNAGGLADAQSTLSVSVPTSVRARRSQVRGGNLEDQDQERPFSSFRPGITQLGLPSSRACERAESVAALVQGQGSVALGLSTSKRVGGSKRSGCNVRAGKTHARDGAGPAARRSMSGSTPAMEREPMNGR